MEVSSKLILFMVAGLSVSAIPLPSSFLTCISSTGSGSTCSLGSGTYDVTSTLTIGRSNIGFRDRALLAPPSSAPPPVFKQ